MPIPISQLETWSHLGSVTQSSSTYNSIKNTLEDKNTPYAAKNYEVFLQGSYGNQTNIFSESDVDVVILLKSCFRHDLSSLSEEQKKKFGAVHHRPTYTENNFKADVLKVLSDRYGRDVIVGEKAISISANAGRRKVDVVVAIEYRRYYEFSSLSNFAYDEGICFQTKSNQTIVNYPKQHSKNLTQKHQDTSKIFKPMIRILKNIRGTLIDKGILENGIVPSYYLEGLLYNVPIELFENNFEEVIIGAIDWLNNAERSKFVCANEQYYLLREGSLVTWRAKECEMFLKAVVKLWNQW